MPCTRVLFVALCRVVRAAHANILVFVFEARWNSSSLRLSRRQASSAHAMRRCSRHQERMLPYLSPNLKPATRFERACRAVR